MWIKLEVVENGYILTLMVGTLAHKQWVVLDRSDIPDAVEEIENYLKKDTAKDAGN